MLDGFVVPHAHFRVFHGNAAAESTAKASHDQLTLLFHAPRAESVLTDLHLREFAQLEVQVKSIATQRQQLQGGPAASSACGLVSVAQAASLAECFSFYARLMTPESFAWPDFVTTVVVKLLDHFVANENDLVRKAILDVLSGSRAHVARVVDAAKILVFVNGLLAQESTESGVETAPKSSRIWALRLVETMPSLAANDANVRVSLLKSLAALDQDEQVAAVHAVRSVLPYSRVLRQAVWKRVTEENSATLVTLVPAAIEENDVNAADQAWNFCAALFHDQVGDGHALLCLQAAGRIVVDFSDTLLSRHLQLIQYVVANDPRPLVVSNVWTTIEDVTIDDASTQSSFFGAISQQLQSTCPVAAKANALVAANRFCKTHTEAPVEVVDAAREFVTNHAQYKPLYVKLIAICAKWELTRDDDREDGERLRYLQELTQYLAPAHFVHRRTVWLTALESLKTLTNQFGELIGDTVVECHVQLLQIAHRKKLAQMEAELWLSLSRVVHHTTIDLVNSASGLFSDETTAALDEKTKQAVAVCVVNSINKENDETSAALCLQLTEASSHSRYEVARVAMCRGVPAVASRLFDSVAEDVENECFGSWLQALVAVNKAEEMVQSSRSVTMNAHHQLINAKALLEAVMSPKYGFDFQVSFVRVRIQWMDLMLRAQQYAGEIAYTKRQGGERERRLSDAFAHNAAEFVAIRSKMLSATALDLDVLASHAQLSALLAIATSKFLTGEASKNVPVVANLPSTDPKSSIARHVAVLSALAADVNNKAARLSSVDPARRPLVGATVFNQLLQSVCTLPSLVPRLFFRSQSRPENAIRCNVQFLTHAEATSYSSKPRARSQLGVAHGTDFTSSLHGCVVFPAASVIRQAARAVTVKITLVCEKAEAGVVVKDQVVQETTVQLPSETPLESGGWLYLPVEMPVHVSTELLKLKGTYAVHATVSLIDSNHETWHMASTGGRRNIIVY